MQALHVTYRNRFPSNRSHRFAVGDQSHPTQADDHHPRRAPATVPRRDPAPAREERRLLHVLGVGDGTRAHTVAAAVPAGAVPLVRKASGHDIVSAFDLSVAPGADDPELLGGHLESGPG